LHHNRTVPSRWTGTGRLLVEGDSTNADLDEIRYASPVMEATISALVHALSPRHLARGVAQIGPDGNVWTTTNKVYEHMEGPMSQVLRNVRLSRANVGGSLNKLRAA